MLHLVKGEENTLVCTLTENVTLSSPVYFLFVFYNRETRQTVTKIFSEDDDTSAYPDRYNAFDIDVDTVFTNKQAGQWDYKVYEQNSESNTDVTQATLIEEGIAILHDAEGSETEPVIFTPTEQQIKVFNG